jgi:ankyrin repeat protein
MTDSEKQRQKNFFNLVFTSIEDALELARTDPSLLNIRDGVGETAFHYVVVENRLDLAEKLLQIGSVVNTQDHAGTTPLMHAVILGYYDMAKWLVLMGADINFKDDLNETALSKAAQNESWRIFDVLISLAQKDINFYFDDFTAQDVLNNNDLLMRDKLISLGLKQRN